jgi:hypothetical protein
MSKIIWATVITTIVVSVILFITLMAVSFETLAFDEYGIKYHYVSRELSTTVDEQVIFLFS